MPTPKKKKLKQTVNPVNRRKIGGWLRAYKYLTVFFCIVATINVVGVSLGYFFLEHSVFESRADGLFFIGDMIIWLVFSIVILKLLNIQKESTVTRIKLTIIIYATISMFFGLGSYAAYIHGFNMKGHLGIVSELLYMTIWVTYFHRSKRVRYFFRDGEAANEDRLPEIKLTVTNVRTV